MEACEDYKGAYDFYYKSAFASDSVAKAMTRIALLDVRNGDYEEAIRHAEWALDYGKKNALAIATLTIALRETGRNESADQIAKEYLAGDPLDHLIRFVNNCSDFYKVLWSDPAQTCLDLAGELDIMGRYADALRLLDGLCEAHAESRVKVVYYALAYFAEKCGQSPALYLAQAKTAPVGHAYPLRLLEIKILSQYDDEDAILLLGCVLYHMRQYERATKLFASCPNSYIARRNLAVAYYSHLGRHEEAEKIMLSLVSERPDDAQLLYESVILMNKMGTSPEKRIRLIKEHNGTREDILVELAKAYNQSGKHDLAIETLLSRDFVPCEGGEHAIADQYMFAYLAKGIMEMNKGQYEQALSYFTQGQVLPQSLGAGIWNHCKYIPLRYRSALCLEALGRKAEADEIYTYIATTQIEYFSNMHLPELPYYQACAYERLGDSFKGRALITEYRRKWERMENVTDNGFFATTPFFLCFIEAPEKLRRAKALYLCGLLDRYLGRDAEADCKMQESYSLNGDNLFAKIM